LISMGILLGYLLYSAVMVGMIIFYLTQWRTQNKILGGATP
jgi:hypothetical protein